MNILPFFMGARSTSNIADLFSITLDTAANLDGVSTTGWDLLVGKSRVNATDWVWRDSAQGISTYLRSNGTNAAAAFSDYATLMSAGNGLLYRLKRAPKFCDVVTYTGDGANPRTLSHNLSTTPGFIIVKTLSTTGDWRIWHRAAGGASTWVGGFLNVNNALSTNVSTGPKNPTPTTFDLDGGAGNANLNGETYVAYLFAHDDGDSGVIQCGSYTGNNLVAGPVVTLGWQPQWLLIKRATGGTGQWLLFDAARGIVAGNDPVLEPNSNVAEDGNTGAQDFVDLTADGFQIVSNASIINNNSNTYIYMAIRSPS